MHINKLMSKNRVFIIAEAGSNWRMGTPTRDIKMAKTLIDIAHNAGADAVKFQTYKPETVYVSNAGESDYLSESGIKVPITEIFRDLSMPYEMIPQLSDHCKKYKIKFMSTPFSVQDANALNPYVTIHKIASYEITHSRLIEFIAKTKKPLILSTGAATYNEIEWAVDHFYENGGKQISLMQATAKYPTPLSMLNLKVIPDLLKRFNIHVGLSDHSIDPIIGPVTAVALGATIIEKHFTLNKNLPGPDHSFALTPEQLKIMVKSIRDCETSLGSGNKIVRKEEHELKRFAQRSIQAIKPIKKGQIFKEDVNIAILRPGKQKQGLHPKFLAEIVNKKSKRYIPPGQGITHNDYE